MNRALVAVALAAVGLVACGGGDVQPAGDASVVDQVLTPDVPGLDTAPTADPGGPDQPADLPADDQPDAGPPDGPPPPPDCGLGDPGDPDRDRVILIGQPFSDQAGEDGTAIRSLSLGSGGASAGQPVDDGMRLEVGTRVARIAFVPSGALALVLGEDGTLVSVAVGGPRDLVVKDQVSLAGVGGTDLRVTADGTIAYAVTEDVGKTSGISTIRVACDGTLTVDAAAFFNVKLSSSLVLVPGAAGGPPDRAILLGGQTTFTDPMDPDDVRLLSLGPQGFAQVDSFDIFGDAIDAGRIALSPDGRTLLIPNGSGFSAEGGQVSVISVEGDTLTEVDRLTDLPSAREALFSPDGRTALISRDEPNRVTILADQGSGLAVVGEVTGIGLASDMAVVGRGTLSGRVVVPSVDPNGGPNLAVLQISGTGVVDDLGQVELGDGIENIPGAIAITE